MVDLHCHTSASFDGTVHPVRVLELARDRGLTHVAITDHDTIAGALDARAARVDGITLIVGQEVRTTEGDLVLLYLEEPVPSGLSPEETVRRARDQGALVGLAHPFDPYRPSIGRGVVRADALKRLASLADYVEIHNGRVREEIHNGRAADFARDHHLPYAATSDAHSETEIGLIATTLDGLIDSSQDLRAALAGDVGLRVSVSRPTQDPQGWFGRVIEAVRRPTAD